MRRRNLSCRLCDFFAASLTDTAQVKIDQGQARYAYFGLLYHCYRKFKLTEGIIKSAAKEPPLIPPSSSFKSCPPFKIPALNVAEYAG